MGEENVEEQMEVGVSGGWKQTLGGGMDGWWWCTHGNSVYGRGGPGSRGVWGKPVGRGSRCARGVAVGRRSKPVEKKEDGGQGPYGVANRACSVRSPHISRRATRRGDGWGQGWIPAVEIRPFVRKRRVVRGAGFGRVSWSAVERTIGGTLVRGFRAGLRRSCATPLTVWGHGNEDPCACSRL